jgi:hypothetical protein
VLVQEGASLVRRDYSQEAWSGPPGGALGYWVGKIPAREPDRRPVIDDDVLLECFHRLQGQHEPAQVHFRYVVALLLMRRKRLKFEDARVADGQEILRLRCVPTRAVYEVVNPSLTDDAIQAVQEEASKVFGWQ